MAEVSSEQHTSAFKLFHYYVPCRIPAAFAYEGQQELVGSTVYANASMAESAGAEMVLRQHTTVELAQLNARGARIILEKPNDAVRMYEWLQDHLQNQRSRMISTINTGKIPVEDLKILDDFATLLYRIARNYQKVDTRQGPLRRRLNSIQQTRLPPKVQSTQQENAEPKTVQEHNPITKDLTRLSIRRGLPQRGR